MLRQIGGKTVDIRFLFVFLGAAAGGAVQSVAGFGGGVLMMLFLPSMFGLLHASAISASICITLTFSLAIRFRKAVRLKKLIFPGTIYLAFCLCAIWISPDLPTGPLKLGFGVFLMLLALFFFCGGRKLKFSATGLTAAATASVSGITAGLFGIGDPPLAPYLLSVARSNEEYIGMMQTMFALSSSVGMLLRIVRGIYTVELLPATVLGTIGILLGKRVGLKMLKKISKENMMKLVYSMIAVSGILTIAANT